LHSQHILFHTCQNDCIQEPLPEDRNLLNTLAECHRACSREQSTLVSQLSHFTSDLRNFSEKAIPDTQLSMRRYADAKHAYLAFCLKVKEMEDEEIEVLGDGGDLSRVANGNMEYRVMLRCRERSRQKFIDERGHVMVKLEMLEEKHGRGLVGMVERLFTTILLSDGTGYAAEEGDGGASDQPPALP